MIQNAPAPWRLAQPIQNCAHAGGSQPAQQTHTHVLHLSANPTLPMQLSLLRKQLPVPLSETSCPSTPLSRSILGPLPSAKPPAQDAPHPPTSNRPGLVGKCQHILQCRNCLGFTLGCLEMGTWFHGWPPDDI